MFYVVHYTIFAFSVATHGHHTSTTKKREVGRRGALPPAGPCVVPVSKWLRSIPATMPPSLPGQATRRRRLRPTSSFPREENLTRLVALFSLICGIL